MDVRKKFLPLRTAKRRTRLQTEVLQSSLLEIFRDNLV